MVKEPEPRQELLLFDIDYITHEQYLVAVHPQGYHVTLVFSPYFIKRMVMFAIKKGILETIRVKPN